MDQIEALLSKYQSRRKKLTARRFAPLGSALATIALAAYALRILK